MLLNRFFLTLAAAAFLMISPCGRAEAAVTATDQDSPGTPARKGDTIRHTITIQSTGSDATGANFSETIDVNTTLVPGSLKASPAATDDTHPQTVIGNVSINSASIPYSVVTNDFLGLNPPATITAYDSASANGGQVVMTTSGAGIGQFTYNPPRGFEGTDTFTYTLSNGTGSNTATVSIAVSGMIWFVNNNPGACSSGCDGRLSHPYTSLAVFNSANGLSGGSNPDNGDTIFIYESATAYTGGVALRQGQKLVGQDATVSLSTITGLTPPSGSAPFPAMNTAGNAARIENGSGNGVSANNVVPAMIRGLSLSGSANAIDVTISSGSAAVGSLEIKDNIIAGAGAEGIDINKDGTGLLTLDIQNNMWNTAGTHTGNAVDINRTAGTLNLNFSSNTDIKSSAGGVVINGGAVANTTITGFSGNSVHKDTAVSGMSISNVTFDANTGTAGIQQVSGGTTTIGTSGDGVGGSGMALTAVQGNLYFSDLDVFADNGAGLRVSGTGSGMTFGVASGAAIVEAVGGPAVDATSVALTLPLSSLKSTNSPTTGVALNSITGSFSAGAGSSISNITSAAGTAFQVGSSNATIGYAGTINTTTGKGVDLTSNTGSAISFTGTLTLSSMTNTAFNATGGGTITSTDTASTLTSTTGTALNVANTTIGAGGLKFRSISAGTAASGPASGIVLNNTGASGSLSVLGTGAAGSGGTIQNTTSHGISLTSTLSPQFSWMNMQNIGRNGIDGQQVTNFTLNNSTINNVGTAAAGQYEESNIAFNDNGLFTGNSVSGSVSITNNTLTNARRHGIDIENGNGTISSLTITGNTLTSSTSAASSLGTAILVALQGSASTSAHLTTGTISSNTIANFPSGEGILVAGGSGNAFNNTSSTLGANGTPITITNNTIYGQAAAASHMGSNAIRASMNSQFGVMNVNITGNGTIANPITNIQGQGISVFAGGSITGTTTINNNVIVANQTLLAGTQGMAVQVDDGPAGSGTSAADYNFIITNNNISNFEGSGIYAFVRASLGKMDATIQNNIVGTPLMANRPGIRVASGSSAGDTTLCMNMSGNTSDGSGINQGIGIRKQGTVATTNDFGIAGLSPSPTTSANAAAKVAADNPAGGGVDVLSGDNFVNCTVTP